MVPSHSSRRILLPARMWFIAFSLIVALVIDMIPNSELDANIDKLHTYLGV